MLLRPVDAANDVESLYAVSHPPDGDLAIWTYLPDGPYENPEQLRQMLAWAETAEDPLYFTLVRLADERPLGLASYLRIEPQFGAIEIGHIWFRRPSAAHYGGNRGHLSVRLATPSMISATDVLQWKCNALNAASRRAAERFGFTFEGVFLQSSDRQELKSATPRGMR